MVERMYFISMVVLTTLGLVMGWWELVAIAGGILLGMLIVERIG